MRATRYYGILAAVLISFASFAQTAKIDSLRKAAALEKIDTLKAKTFYRITIAYMEMGIADSAYRYALLSKQLSKKNKFYNNY